MVKVLKFRTLSSFCSKKKVGFRARIHKMFVRIANREDPDQTDPGLHCLSRLFGRQLVFKILEPLLYALTLCIRNKNSCHKDFKFLRFDCIYIGK